MTYEDQQIGTLRLEPERVDYLLDLISSNAPVSIDTWNDYIEVTYSDETAIVFLAKEGL